jgi:hypothetical protein
VHTQASILHPGEAIGQRSGDDEPVGATRMGAVIRMVMAQQRRADSRAVEIRVSRDIE